MNQVTNKLRVIHIPQVPMEGFVQNVNSEREAFLLEKAFSMQHLFLFENNLIEDYCNVICVEMFEDGEWVDYWNETEMMEWDEYRDTYLNPNDDK